MNVSSRYPALALCLLASCPVFSQGTGVDVGSGSIDSVIRQQFVNAFYRSNFSNVVATPPVADVRRYGSTGLIQEFNPLSGSGGRLALVKANTSTAIIDEQTGVYQILSLLYANYSAVGVTTAGYPAMDTAQCTNTAAGTCYWQLFDRKYALFSYASALANGLQNFTVRDPYFTLWQNSGGITVLGAASSAETTATTPTANAYTFQSFQNGFIFNITSGTLNGRQIVVAPPVSQTYLNNGGPTGFLGLPIAAVVSLGANRFRQSFENGSLDFDSSGNIAVRLPVNNIGLSANITTLRLKLNETYQITAIPRSATGDDLLDRPVAWTTTNGRVISIQTSGRTATLKAVGGGVATITATTEGRISAPIQVFVQTTCCQVGEGAPSASATQAFQDAVTRNRLALNLPSPNPVRRVGNGNTQEFSTTAGTRILLALPDRVPQAYLLSGPLLSRYEDFGGPAGGLGYPLSDPTAGGRQTFENGTLAGGPVRLVSGPIFTKWQTLGLETGTAGSPVSDVTSFFTFAATGGTQQTFRGGAFYSVPVAGRVNFVGGVIYAKYLELTAANGSLGAPLNDEFVVSGRRRQDFEGGYLELPPGATEATLVQTPRRPSLTATPATVIVGSRVRLAVGGFGDNTRLRVRLSGQPDFFVQAPNGAYAWDTLVPTNAPSGTVTVIADEPGTTRSAQATYTVRALADARPRLTKARGDAQAGAPGSLLPIPLRIQLRDEASNPLAGVAVAFTASQGAVLSRAAAATDSNGEAEVTLRLPSAEGIALVTAEALRQVVTFQARTTGGGLTSFPRVTDPGNPFVASAAAIIKYHQDRGEVPASGPPASPATLDAYLRSFCLFDSQAVQICDGFLENGMANLWRLGGFVSGGLEILALPPTEQVLRDSVATGPVLVSLALEGGASHAVVATGITTAGNIQIMDPSPTFSRTSLADYQNGFQVGNTSYKGRIVGLVRLEPRTPANVGFLVIAETANIAIAAPSGVCGATFAIQRGGNLTNFRSCDGAQPNYQLDLAAPSRYRATLSDLGTIGARYLLEGQNTGSFRVARPGLQWEPGPLETTFLSTAVLNGASFTSELAPGALVSIFGLGLGREGAPTTAEIGGRPAQILFSSPFQINLALPLDLLPGSYPLSLQSIFGSAEVRVDVRDVAPAIFRLSESQMAVVNTNGTLNNPTQPAARGSVIVLYGTGFGAVQLQGNLSRTTRPVSARISNLEVPVGYSGLAPGYIGLYQLNVNLPVDMPPGLFHTLELRQAGVVATPLTVSIQ